MVGRLIRDRRLARGWSQEALANALGSTQRQVTRWEGYTTQLPRGVLRDRLGAALGIAPAEWHLAAAAAAGEAVPDPAPEKKRPRLLTEAELYERFGIKPYEEPRSAEGLRYSAGPGASVIQGIDDAMPRRVRGSKVLWEAPVVGDCMTDEINPGEVVIYSTKLGAEIGKVMVALRDEEELIIKRLKLAGDKQVLRPNHGKDVPVDERIRFLGRGVSVQRPLL